MKFVLDSYAFHLICPGFSIGHTPSTEPEYEFASNITKSPTSFLIWRKGGSHDHGREQGPRSPRP
jgi:hypothetical protein